MWKAEASIVPARPEKRDGLVSLGLSVQGRFFCSKNREEGAPFPGPAGSRTRSSPPKGLHKWLRGCHPRQCYQMPLLKSTQNLMIQKAYKQEEGYFFRITRR